VHKSWSNRPLAAPLALLAPGSRTPPAPIPDLLDTRSHTTEGAFRLVIDDGLPDASDLVRARLRPSASPSPPLGPEPTPEDLSAWAAAHFGLAHPRGIAPAVNLPGSPELPLDWREPAGAARSSSSGRQAAVPGVARRHVRLQERVWVEARGRWFRWAPANGAAKGRHPV
jgi:hypothetical protein